jgi:hypothetical protein
MIKQRRIRWTGNVARRGGKRKTASRILMGKSEGKRPIRRPKRMWECNIKMNLIEIEQS